MNPWTWATARLSAFHVPDEILTQSDSLGAELPYEAVLSGFLRPVVLMGDGGVCLVWRLSPAPHEVMTNDAIQALSHHLAEALAQVDAPDAVLSLIADGMPSWSVPKPSYLQGDGELTVAQEVLSRRVAHLERIAGGLQLKRSQMRTMRRELYVTLRLAGLPESTGVWPRLKCVLMGVEAAEEETAHRFMEAVDRLLEVGQQLEGSLETLGLSPEPCEADTLLTLLRRVWHDEPTLQQNPCCTASYDPTRRLGDQVPKDFVAGNRAGVSVGQDTWEVISWLQQPPHVYYGLFHLLLGLSVPYRFVLTIRPCTDRDLLDLTVAATQLKTPLLGGERKVRHLEELRHAEERQVHGEKLMWCDMRLLVKNEDVALDELKHRGCARHIAHDLSQRTGIELVVERDAALGLFLLAQPLVLTPSSAWFSGRQLRVLTSALGPYLPVFGGFRGTGDEPRHRVQLMHDRSCQPTWLSLRANQTSAHAAVLASTGAGKSFYLANLLCAEAAAEPDALLFVVDSLTSYRVLGEVLGEDGGFSFIQPPQRMPNVWQGTLSNERLGVLVGLLQAAIGLVDPEFRFLSEHSALLERAIRKAFSDRELEAGTELGLEELFESSAEVGLEAPRLLPRLSDVVENLAAVAAIEGLPETLVQQLRLKLSAFFGKGRYADFFDAHIVAPADPPTPQFSLYDFGLIEDETIRALTLLVCVSEVARQVTRPENVGRQGVLLVEEAGVLLSQKGEAADALVEFVRGAWKTFRKLGVACIGSTNEPSDYLDKAGPQAIWANSPNKVFLRLKADDLRRARLADPSTGRPALLEGELLGELVESLHKEDGRFSQGLWASDEVVGSFTYVPSGYDYWLAASKPIEVGVFERVRASLGSARAALHWLAEHWPAGVRADDGELRMLTTQEVPSCG